MCAMAPERIDLEGKFARQSEEDKQREKLMKRFETLGLGIMNRAQGGPMTHDTLGSVLSDPTKRANAAQILGQAYLIAFNFMRANRDGVQQVAEVLIERREMHGDEVVELLDGVRLVEPAIDITQERSWPTI